MLRDVRERLGDDEVGGGLDMRRQRVGVVADLHRNRSTLGESPDGGAEPLIGQHRRVDSARELTQLAERALHLELGLVEQARRRVVVLRLAT